jgi:rare lipoprotein A
MSARHGGKGALSHLPRLLCGLALIATMLALAGCGGNRTKPSKSAGSRGSSSSPAGASGRYDDTSRPQSSRYHVDSDSVPTEIPDVSNIPEPVPKIEPRSLYGNKSPYSVLGRSYSVLPSPAGYVERGIASFYGNKFHGYKTSSLENYDMYQFSAAHKTLPLPSYARVTNLENGKSVIVRVNDRGPFHENRIIDLSFAAAVKIGVWPKGTGLVEVRAIDPSRPNDAPAPPLASANPAPAIIPPPRSIQTAPLADTRPAISTPLPLPAPATSTMEPAAPLAVPVPGPKPTIYLQVGAFSDIANASRVADQLNRAGLGPVSLIETTVNGRSVRRVRVGPLADVDTADRVTEQIAGMGLPRPQVAVD